ncbi:MAG: 16S rRNA (cytosine(1402)-N(4))-methyltransferase RsmH, partial [bacterium]
MALPLISHPVPDPRETPFISSHYPAQGDLVAKFLLETGGERFIDCTAGSGGHIQVLLEKTSRPIKVLALDIDPYAIIRLKERFHHCSNVTVVQGDFRYLERIAGEQRFLPVDGILADLGQSREQLDEPHRGFSFERDGPLDMRYDPHSTITAAHIVNTWTKNDLIKLFHKVGGEHRAVPIVHAIVANRPIHTTEELRAVIESAAGKNFIFKTLSRIFMALRVAVNGELEAIQELLLSSPDLLSPGGRLVV